jgi:acetolactate synthase-1/2/3 large subunit
LWTYNPMNFAKLAEDMGALGIRVERASQFAPALAQAFAAKRTAVIDVATDIEALAPTAVA